MNRPVEDLEFIGFIRHRNESESIPAAKEVLNTDFIRDLAKAHEDAGFDRTLVGYYADGPDTFLIALHAASVTSRLGMLIAHRPGFVSPPVAARKFATFDQLTKGRVAIHTISGGSDVDQMRDGDYLNKAERYARTDEYLTALRAIWTANQPVSHSGKYYKFEGARENIATFQKPRIPIYFGGASKEALDVASRQADVYMLMGETKAEVLDFTGRIRAMAKSHGRDLRFSLSFRPIIEDTEELAWKKAEHILNTIVELQKKQGLPYRAHPGEGYDRLRKLAEQGARLDDRLWTAIAAATGAKGNSTCLVGTPEQVAETLAEYWDIGVSTFLVRGFDPLQDVRDYGKSLLPYTRQAIELKTRKRAS
ncbi:MAG: LLM class flavin-dependent oxidoreductase [Rhizobiales bacterium]|nr:LLM class flavin-dependent oxidoreductase [Hyphomicrobiales bacterium]